MTVAAALAHDDAVRAERLLVGDDWLPDADAPLANRIAACLVLQPSTCGACDNPPGRASTLFASNAGWEQGDCPGRGRIWLAFGRGLV